MTGVEPPLGKPECRSHSRSGYRVSCDSYSKTVAGPGSAKTSVGRVTKWITALREAAIEGGRNMMLHRGIPVEGGPGFMACPESQFQLPVCRPSGKQQPHFERLVSNKERVKIHILHSASLSSASQRFAFRHSPSTNRMKVYLRPYLAYSLQGFYVRNAWDLQCISLLTRQRSSAKPRYP